tara:strand:+ start:19846 stop:21093 length:1248 start_codon:yes stop_codon:yes gene_type:complete
MIIIKNLNKYRAEFFFIFTIIIYLSYQAWSLPNWFFGGDMWAEMATNYYHNSLSPSLYTQLLSTDAGYLPLPSRLIAFVGGVVGLDASITPYYYTYSSSIFSAILVGVFCLPPFRIVIKSDVLRFCIGIINLLVIGFEESNFVNVFYLSAFFITVCSLLPLNSRFNTPNWFWLIPFLMISKPAVLATMPLLCISAIYGDKKFKVITFVTLFASFIQLSQMLYSRYQLDMFSIERNILDVCYIVYRMLFSTIGKYIYGSLMPSGDYSLYFGILTVIVLLVIVVISSSKYKFFIIFGFILVLFNTLLNSVTLDYWDGNVDLYNRLFFNRHTWVSFIGICFVVVGIILILNRGESNLKAVLLLIAWFIASGWTDKIRIPENEPRLIYEWQKTVTNIHEGESAIININPNGWKYQYSKR